MIDLSCDIYKLIYNNHNCCDKILFKLDFRIYREIITEQNLKYEHFHWPLLTSSSINRFKC